MPNELVVEGDDSAPMSEATYPNRIDAIEELQEEEEAEQEWASTAQEGDPRRIRPAEDKTAQCYEL